MLDRANVIYRTDGSFEGLLCCVFESFERKELPADIVSGDEEQVSLLPIRDILTDPEKAGRVRASIPKKLGREAEELIENAFLYGESGRDLAILEFMRLAYRHGPRTPGMLDLAPVQRVFAMARAVTHEAHLFTGFVRFSEIGGGLVSQISPRHFVLPLMAEHFCGRFCEERFLIHDQTHGAALLYRPYEAQLIELLDFTPAAPDREEALFQRMWSDYYHVVAIKERENPRCRMGHMPKRYWANLTEMRQNPAAGNALPPAISRLPK